MAQKSTEKKTAGAFDVRSIIGLLLTVYGVILTVVGLVGGADDKTGGINANLWAGLVMLVVGVGFMAWARLRPIAVPDHVDRDDIEAPPSH